MELEGEIGVTPRVPLPVRGEEQHRGTAGGREREQHLVRESVAAAEVVDHEHRSFGAGSRQRHVGHRRERLGDGGRPRLPFEPGEALRLRQLAEPGADQRIGEHQLVL